MKKIILFLLALSLIGTHATSQDRKRTITGTVRSALDQQPLEGVSICIKGTTFFSGTQADGIYYIPVSGTDSILVFQLEGYQPKEIHLTSKSNEYNLLLEPKTDFELLKPTHLYTQSFGILVIMQQRAVSTTGTILPKPFL